MAAVNNLIYLNVLNALEDAEILATMPARRLYPYIDPFEELSDRKFVKLYRLTKPVAEQLINILEPHMRAPTRISALSIPRKVVTALRFFASGSYQWDIARKINHGIAQTSVSNALHEVIDTMNLPNIFNQFVHLPRNVGELQRLRHIFYERHGFPGIFSCVDCTHIAIVPPVNDGVHHEAAYVNRKGYHSINTQLICDFDLKIMNVSAIFPGSTHDSYIWNNSNAYQYVRNLHNNGLPSFSLLGDSGYALRPWMLTPINNVLPGSPQERYNQAQASTRSLIERCNGVLKMRSRCLLKHRVLHYSPETSSKIINCCTILHNMCIDNNIPEVQFGDEDEDQFINVDYGMYDIEPNEEHLNPIRINPELAAGRRLQQVIIRNHFQ